MQKNDMAVVKITDMGVNGEGIGKSDGYPLFIKDAVMGDTVEAKVMKAKKNYGYARLMKVIEPSADRVEPKCPFARRCGGCQIQEMSYERQLVFKNQKVRNSLERIGGFSPKLLNRVTEPIVGMDEPFFYRNKAQFPFGTDKEGNPVAGFYAGRTHDIIANTDCALGVPVNREILETILDFMKENRISAYDEKTGRGLIRHVLIRYGFTTKEIMVCLVVNGKKIPHVDCLTDKLTKIKGMTSITMSMNTRQTNVIMGDSFEVLWGQGYIMGLYRRYQVPHFTVVLLSGESGTDRKALQPRNGICRLKRRGNCVGFVLWDRNDLFVSGAEGGEGVRCGDRASGHKRRKRECKA